LFNKVKQNEHNGNFQYVVKIKHIS
jgi:hypothetical protein